MIGDSRLNAERAALEIQARLKDAERHRLAALVSSGPRWPFWRSLAFRRLARSVGLAAADRAGLEVRIRYGGPGDELAVAQLAALDSARVPEQPVLIAEVDGRALAVMSLWDGTVIADPFHQTKALVELLAVRAAQIQSAGGALRELREAGSPWRRRSEPGSERA